MAIKNKDGSNYKLSGPNPHMKNQLLWDHFELHNMNFKEVNDLIKKEKDIPKKEYIPEDIIKEEDITKEEYITKEEDIPKEEYIPKVKDVQKEEDVPKVKKITIYCLPAIIEVHEDILYGEIRKTIKYDKKFKFEAILISNNDISFEVWTNAIELGNGSILYPQNFDKRWWKVNSTSEKFDGFLLSCSPSNITPSFEDL